MKKPVKKMQTGGSTKPTYKNLGLARSAANKEEGKDFNTPANKKDSLDYKKGFNMGKAGIKPNPLRAKYEGKNQYEEKGRWEGQNSKNKTMKKSQNGTKVGGPTYVNLKVKNPKAKDSADYKKGYDNVKSGKKTYFPNRATSEGVNEGLGRLNRGVKAKAKSGTSLGMKSVKSGYDNNSGVTRADFVAIGKGTAKSGTKMKMGGKMAKQAAVAIAMKKAGKTPKKMQYSGKAASMAPMKNGGKMKTCMQGCK